MKQTLLDKLIQFRHELYQLFPKRADATMNLLDALTAHGHQYHSVIQLSLANCFKRKYSSVTDAIADGLTEVDWQRVMLLIDKYTREDKDNQAPCFVIDCTGVPRPFANKLKDKMIIYAPNPDPGNKPICVGHPYSILGLLATDKYAAAKHWIQPLSSQRVGSNQKGNEVGMEQITEAILQLGLSDQLTLSVGDSLYGSQRCRQSASALNNLVHIFRLSSNRNVFAPPSEMTTGKKGRPRSYGAKMQLNDPDSHVPYDEQVELGWSNAHGRKGTVTISCWHDRLLRGSRQFRSDQHPFNLLRITIADEEGNAVFKRPLWLGVMGERRHEISLENCYQRYRARYDIEHFFRLVKKNLMMSTYQTPDVTHEVVWLRLCQLAYTQLYLARELALLMPRAWERYLASYQESNDDTPMVLSPAQTQRGFSNLLEKLGTPAGACIARGKPRGRQKGEIQVKRKKEGIVFKAKKRTGSTSQPIIRGSEERLETQTLKKIGDLIQHVNNELQYLQIPSEEFTKILLDST